MKKLLIWGFECYCSEEYGGPGLDSVTVAVIYEELGKGCAVLLPQWLRTPWRLILF
ncbi:MAG: acyl-CoA dehydrogenase family protein [Phascolarctobacterium faecium]